MFVFLSTDNSCLNNRFHNYLMAANQDVSAQLPVDRWKLYPNKQPPIFIIIIIISCSNLFDPIKFDHFLQYG